MVSITKPTVGGSSGTWGTELNTALDALVAGVNASAPLTPTAVKTGAYTAVAGELVLANAVSAGFTITLPAASTTGTVVGVKKTDASANVVTVVAPSSKTIDGDANATLNNQNAAAGFVYDGTNWQVSSTAVRGIPSGGTSGQLLRKNSSTAYDAIWANSTSTSAGAFFGWQAGRSYYHLPIVVNQIVTGNSATFPSGYTYLFPCWVPNACTVATVSWYGGAVTSAATIGLSLYADSPSAPSGGPATVLVSANANVTTGFQFNYHAVNYAFTAPQMIWIALNLSAMGAYITGINPGGYLTNLIVQPTNQWNSPAIFALRSGLTPPSNMTNASMTSQYQNSFPYLPLFQITIA